MEKKDKLVSDLTNSLNQIKSLINEHQWDINKNRELWNKMVDDASELHKLVKPTHHKYMIQNRRVSPDEREFYNHIHPVEDLLRFIKDPHANDDPEDQTINHEFEIKIYSRRWEHDDIYHIKRIEDGWEVLHLTLSGVCDKSGRPYIFENLRQDSINYPEALPGYLEWLWEKSAETGLTHEQVQLSLNELGNWISACEKTSPTGIWETYK